MDGRGRKDVVARKAVILPCGKDVLEIQSCSGEHWQDREGPVKPTCESCIKYWVHCNPHGMIGERFPLLRVSSG